MKIKSLHIEQRTCRYEPKYPNEARSSGPLDIYEEYNSNTRSRYMRQGGSSGNGEKTALFLVITTDEGVSGEYGPIENRAEILTIMDGIAQHLIGRDPVENRKNWDIISRFDRHSRSGVMMMAISAVDIALWDLKGKILGMPVYKILGGGRQKLKPYVSMLSFSIELEKAKEKAIWVKDMGITAQKWFFRYGPAEGAVGMKKNLSLAFALREALGEGYELMFDCWMGWTVNYAKAILKELEPVRPMWVEEILRPHMLDGYRNLSQSTSIPLAAGEHIYTRMEVNTYLKENVLSVMQSDPAWCGGITEALRIGDLCELYGTTFIPHGHTLMPALHVVAALPSDICPYCEYLLNFMDSKNAFFKHNYKGIEEGGFITMPDCPGIGDEIDEERLIKREVVKGFEF